MSEGMSGGDSEMLSLCGDAGLLDESSPTAFRRYGL